MFRIRTLRLLTLGAVITVLSTSCFFAAAFTAEQQTEPVPWFCDPTAPNSVVGPPVLGSVDWYAGIDRGPLSYEDCKTLALQLDQVEAHAAQYPDVASAEAAGYRNTFERIPGMGTHHGLGAVTPELLADPAFDPLNPIFPGSPIDDVFEPGKPEYLQYDTNMPGGPLVGASYYVRTDTGLPPEGFAGDNDWWHHHPRLCFDPATAIANLGVGISDSLCENRGGINLHLEDYYMMHVWVIDDIERHPDIYAPLNFCIGDQNTIFDMSDPCHQVGAGAPAPGQGAAPEQQFFCPIGTINDAFTE